MSDITRNTHYVPQATLRRWSENGSHIYAYDILVSHANVPDWQRRGIKRVARHVDLYTTLEGAEETDRVEKQITRMYEEPGQEAIEKLLNKQRMSPLDWKSVARFVALQQMRTPLYFVEFVKRLNEQASTVLEKIVQELPKRLEAHHGSNVRPKSEVGDEPNYLGDHIRISVQPGVGPAGETEVAATFSSSRAAWLSTITGMLVRLDGVICQHRWRAIEPAGNAEWPLTDHPVLTLNYVGSGQYDFGAGWGRKGSEFVLPISPHIAVCTQVGSNNHGPRQMTVDQTRSLQRFMAERAFRFIIARPGVAEWVRSAKPRTIDAEAYATEQEAWRRWHSVHIESEQQFRADSTPRKP